MKQNELLHGLELALAARNIFDKAHPYFPEEHWHFRVAKASKLKSVVRPSSRDYLKLSTEEVALLQDALEEMGDTSISFSKFCLVLYELVLVNCPLIIDIDREQPKKFDKKQKNQETFHFGSIHRSRRGLER